MSQPIPNIDTNEDIEIIEQESRPIKLIEQEFPSIAQYLRPVAHTSNTAVYEANHFSHEWNKAITNCTEARRHMQIQKEELSVDDLDQNKGMDDLIDSLVQKCASN